MGNGRNLTSRFVFAALLLLAAAGAVWAGGPGSPENEWNGAKAKYVFMFIGDGMGLQQIGATEVYLGSRRTGDGREPKIGKLAFSGFKRLGMITTYSTNSFITDSAPAATALATGYKTDKGIIGVDAAKAKSFTTVAEMAKAKGMKVGNITSASINHATPAAFYAHTASRDDYYGIGMQLLNSGVDYFGGGGFHQHRGRRNDQKSLYEVAEEKGVVVVRDRAGISALTPASVGGKRVFAVNPVLDENSAMPYEIDRTPEELSLAEFTRKGIELLDNDKGFFFHVEGGKIDWSCHANDAMTSIRDTLAFDDAIKEALAFAEKHPDETLIVVVGDHETGGMSIGFARTEYETFFEKIGEQKESYLSFNKKIAEYRESGKDNFDEFFPTITASFGLANLTGDEAAQLKKRAQDGDTEAARKLALNLSAFELASLREAFEHSMDKEKLRQAKTHEPEQVFLLYGGYEPLSVKVTHILNQKAGIGWTTYAHTGIPVPVFASGVGAELFSGYYDNTDVAWKTMSIMGLDPVAPSDFAVSK